MWGPSVLGGQVQLWFQHDFWNSLMIMVNTPMSICPYMCHMCFFIVGYETVTCPGDISLCRLNLKAIRMFYSKSFRHVQNIDKNMSLFWLYKACLVTPLICQPNFPCPGQRFSSSMQFQKRVTCKSGHEAARLSQYSPAYLLSTFPSAFIWLGLHYLSLIRQLYFLFASPLFPPLPETPPALTFLVVVCQPCDQAQTTLLSKCNCFLPSHTHGTSCMHSVSSSIVPWHMATTDISGGTILHCAEVFCAFQ